MAKDVAACFNSHTGHVFILFLFSQNWMRQRKNKMKSIIDPEPDFISNGLPICKINCLTKAQSLLDVITSSAMMV